jgi:hypothetical protein
MRRLVQKLSHRYGHEDAVVMQLKEDLNAMEAAIGAVRIAHSKKYHHPHCFQTAAKQHYYDSNRNIAQ